MHGLNGDILVWNPVTRRRHELSSMGIRVNAETLRRQLELTGQLDWLELPYHQGIVSGELPLSIGGGIGQSRTQMLLLKKAHLGEVSVTVWPQILKEMCARARHPRARMSATVRRHPYAYALAAAVAVGSLLIGLSVISAHRGTATSTTPGVAVAGTAETAALLRGIPQQGNMLGSAIAPVELVGYADPQCPYCALYARDVLPALVRDYVRSGRVRMVYRGLWFLGPDSGTALRTATAAGSENRFWNVLELLYRNQGAENAWVNDDLLRSIVTAAGADVGRVFALRDGAEVGAMIDSWGRMAQADGINAVPAFYLGPRGGTLERLEVTALTPAAFRAAIDRALRE